MDACQLAICWRWLKYLSGSPFRVPRCDLKIFHCNKHVVMTRSFLFAPRNYTVTTSRATQRSACAEPTSSNSVANSNNSWYKPRWNRYYRYVSTSSIYLVRDHHTTLRYLLPHIFTTSIQHSSATFIWRAVYGIGHNIEDYFRAIYMMVWAHGKACQALCELGT